MTSVRTHESIDERSLALVRAIVARIDADPERRGLEHARRVCRTWGEAGNRPALEWAEIIARPWDEIRRVLLDESDNGQRLRQSNPFCGILSPRERWAIYREFRDQ